MIGYTFKLFFWVKWVPGLRATQLCFKFTDLGL